MKNIFLLAVLGVFLHAGVSQACESCTISRLGKDDALVSTKEQGRKLYFEYLFEQKNWDRMDPHDAHELHHDGHDVHDRTTEDFHHFRIGGLITEDLHLFAALPYVIRRSLEVDSHAILGSKQKAEGMGDLNVIGDYRFWKKGPQGVSAVLGLKFPTGSTEEKNSAGTPFEPEMQPGTGSVDYLVGGIYELNKGRSSLVGNWSYVLKTEGDHDFEAGDVFTTSLYYNYLLNPDSRNFKTRVGVDMVFQTEQKQKMDGEKVDDSGGDTILTGPSFKIDTGKHLSFLGNILFPAYQDLGGVHQQLDYEWTLGGQVKW